MPKVKKIRAAALTNEAVRQDPLGQVIDKASNGNKYATVSRRTKTKKKRDNTDDDDDMLLDSKTSQRIINLSREQQLEVEAEEAKKNEQERRNNLKRKQQQRHPAKSGGNSSSDEEDEEDEQRREEEFIDDDNFVIENDQGYINLVEGTEGLSAEDEAVVASMMNNNIEERRNLADIILAKIEEHEAMKRGELHGDEAAQQQQQQQNQLPQKVVDVYTEIGKILSRYTSGKLPKAFKIIPSLSNWEDVLILTRPDRWTPQAMYAATRIFASNLNPKMAQRFYNLVLLESVRDDIRANKKLNYHYFIALKKAVYKPAAFFKGILLPLCHSQDCTLREAAIVCAVLQRVSIPVHHSAVAIHKLAQLQEYNGVASIFIKTLLNKKYSLPAPIIGTLVGHYANFIHDDRTLPVLWHQSLLVFVQRYKNEIRDEARESLRLVMKKHYHHKITREIRRELFGSQAWKEERSYNTNNNMSTTTSTIGSTDEPESMVC